MLEYSISFLLSCGVFALGKYMATHTQAAGRIFFWAPRFAALYFRFAGMFFVAGGIVGMLLYLTFIVVHFT